jgi:hypothetical protein
MKVCTILFILILLLVFPVYYDHTSRPKFVLRHTPSVSSLCRGETSRGRQISRYTTSPGTSVLSCNTSTIACHDVRSQVLKVPRMKVTAFWDLLKAYRRFRGMYCILQQAILRPSLRWSSSWWWSQYAPLKRRSTPMTLHGAISQKDGVFSLSRCLLTCWSTVYL